MVILMHKCRLCQINTGSISLQENLCELILEVTNIKVNVTSELPSTICLICNNKIREIDQYVKGIQKINNHLQMCIKKYEEPTDITKVLFDKPYLERLNAQTESVIDLNETKAKEECFSDKTKENACHLSFYNHQCGNSSKSVQQQNYIISGT